MPTGLQVFNTAGSVIIDHDYLSMNFLAKGSITLDQKYFARFQAGASGPDYFAQGPYFENAWRSSTGAVASTTGGTLCAFRSRDATRAVGVASGGYGSTEFVGYNSTDATAPIVDYWLFGTASKASVGSGFGMEIYDGASNLVYTTANKSMVITAATGSDVSLPGLTLTGPASSYALCVGLPMGAVRNGSETAQTVGYGWLEGRALWYAPTSTGFAACTTQPTARRNNNSYPTGIRENAIPGTMLLVDVTGL